MGGTNVSCQLTVPDPDLKIRWGWGGRVPRSTPLDPPLVKI